MQVHYSVDNLPSFTNSVITIGTFDGVHEGHRKIISALIKEANKNQGESIIITFHPHPRKVVYPEEPLQLINTLNEKIELLSKTGIDHVVVVPFTKEFAEKTAQQYISEFLVNNFHPRSIIIGFDHHFGKDRKGNYRLLEEYSDKCQFSLIEIPKHILDEIGVSSTKIRQALLNSKIETANKLLGYEFFFEGKVVLGDQLGRTLGYPTANLEYTERDKIHLGHGVYAAYVQLDNILKKGMLSIGKRPTLPGMQDEKVEINIFDWEGSLYGETIRIIVKKFLRQQEKYSSLEELARQLGKDKQDSLTVL
jgi:riboflavin kinase/FMN adenylyltransferase